MITPERTRALAGPLLTVAFVSLLAGPATAQTSLILRGTPGGSDQGRVNDDPETGLMAYWQHWRTASDPEPAFTLAWTEWTRHGPLLLSSGRPDSTGYSRVNFENMEASLELPAGMFEGPEG